MAKNIEKNTASLLKTLNQWVEALEKYNEEQLKQETSDSKWTIGQVYHHLMETSNGILENIIPKCLADPNMNADKKVTMSGKAVLLFGQIPPVRAKFKGEGPKQPKNKLEIAEGMQTLVGLVKGLQAQLTEATNSGRFQHFVFGYLTAWDWFKFINIHFKHHLRQKKRIDSELFA